MRLTRVVRNKECDIKILNIAFWSIPVAFLLLLEAKIFIPLVAGTPSYNSLELLSGDLLSVSECTKAKDSSIPIKVLSKKQEISLFVPCADDLKYLNKKIDKPIEIRSRKVGYSFLEENEIWGVKVDGLELYYDSRVKYHRSPMLLFFGFLALLLPVIIYKFIFKLEKKVSA